MIWTHKITDTKTEPGRNTVRVLYSNDTDGKTIDQTFFSATDNCSGQIYAQQDVLNAFDSTALSGLVNGQPAPKPAQPVVIPPTAEQVAQQSFLVLLNDASQKWDEFKNSQAQKVPTKLQQSDVDAAMTAWKSDYIDAYAPFLVGRFQ